MKIEDIIVMLSDEWGKTPYEINDGDCEEFAYAVLGYLLNDPYKDQHDNCRELCESNFLDFGDLPGHTWVYYNGKHYDAECPDGVTDWRHLPLYEKIRDIPPLSRDLRDDGGKAGRQRILERQGVGMRLIEFPIPKGYIELLGNFLEIISEGHKEAIRLLDHESAKGKDRSSFSQASNEPVGLLPCYARLFHSLEDSMARSAGAVRASYFYAHAEPMGWHVDNSGTAPVIVSAYPHQTQILQPDDPDVLVADGRTYPPSNLVDRLLRKGRASILTPEPGDIYLLGPGVLHRRNPESCHDHLVVRIAPKGDIEIEEA